MTDPLNVGEDQPERKIIAINNAIIRCTVGSKLHGVNMPGTDDTDEMGVCIEPPEYVIGLRQFEQFVSRTQPEGHPSGPGDLDLTIYGLRKFVRLALSGNPTILMLFFAPESACSIRTSLGVELQAMAPLFMAKSVAAPFLGYLEAQRQRMTGERGGRAVRKPENPYYSAEQGYDTKYAMHMMRLGYQAIEVLETGKMSLPVKEPERAYLLSCRRGELTKNEVLTTTGELESKIKDLRDTSPLQDRPDEKAVEDWLVRTYLRYGSWL